MPSDRLRVGLDANVLIAGVRLPRWPYEVLRASIRGSFETVLPEQVILEARRHLGDEPHRAALGEYLAGALCEEIPMPSARRVKDELDLVRSEKDVPIALALLDGNVDVFVTNDRDFTDPGATAQRFRSRVKVMLTAVFLRDVLGWTPGALESIRNRTWAEIDA